MPVTCRDTRQCYRHPALDKLRSDILEQPDEHVSIEALCERFHLSRRALQNYFEEATGLAPLEFTAEVLKMLKVWRPETIRAWYQLHKTRKERWYHALVASMGPGPAEQ